MKTEPALRLHRFLLSGHSHRAQLFLSLLGLQFELIEVDMRKGEHKSANFLAKNPFGQVPVLEHGEVTVADSNAILVYLASRFDTQGQWLPGDPERLALVQQWLSVAAGPLASGPATARLVNVFGAPLDQARAQAVARQLFTVMEQHLRTQPFLVGKEPTIADVANYSYVAVAPEGGVDLAPYPNLSAWLVRMEGLPGFVHMQRTNVGLATA